MTTNEYPDYNNKEHRDCIRSNLSNCGSGVIDDACEMIDFLEAKVRELEATIAACKVHTKDPSSRCGNRYEPENGEFVTPCHLPSGHDGEHQGYCLGSRCVWSDDTSEAAEKAPSGEWYLDGYQVAVWVYKRPDCRVSVCLRDDGSFEHNVIPYARPELRATGTHPTLAAAQLAAEEALKKIG